MAPTASRRPGRPPAAKADETRKRIVDAARLVFSERGYDGATFQAVAVRADLTRPAINHYFSSKRALYREVVNQTNELVVAAGIRRAECETTLLGRLTAFISAAMQANSENPSASAFLVTTVLESQRHPDLNTTENDAVRMTREFLTRVVNDAIAHRELAADIDAPAVVETLLVVLCGVGFYSGYVRSYREMLAVTGVLRQLLEGALWRPQT
ncbi:TetR/AcrR family transcriptional regulator [Mycobacterium sp. 663a-19]|uniref:TetR/AcrR family transcriptional regulator n=1 Tax=Mycobacterium sp. 663a-19 TaxID=2986148 RepID=UPI002D1F503B|nr:TetR/AcrR family transcriptional regulator [Mycobacterium sp. 663a-19]MEB3980625.1 TetR/AcrR family transcriptional regulator [Mycobacterium sp. 663a-19]